MFRIPLPIVMQHGPGLESALSFLSLGGFSDRVDFVPCAADLESLWSFPGLIPPADRVRVEDLIRQGDPAEIFRILSLHEPNIRRLHQRYLEGSALQESRMTLEEAKTRPWAQRIVATALKRNFERFRELALREMRAEIPSKSLADDFYRLCNALPSADANWDAAAQRLVKGAWLHHGHLPEGRAEGGIYFSLSGKRVNDVWFYLLKSLEPSLNERGAFVEYKMHEFPGRVGRSDSLVLSFRARDQKLIYQEILKLHGRYPEAFQPGAPAFAMPLMDPAGKIMPGASFAQSSHEGFENKRCRVLARGVRIARLLLQEGQEVDWSELRRIFVHVMESSGIDPRNPAFDRGGPELFPIFASLPLRPALLDAPGFECGLIQDEFRERYPCLSASDLTPLVEKMADDAYELWKGSGRQPGQKPDAAAEVPEDALDAVVKKLIETLATGNHGPRFQKLLADLRTGDQGPRIVRGLKIRLGRDLPTLREASAGLAIHELSWDVYRTWLTKPNLSFEALEAIRKNKLNGLRNHLRSLPRGSSQVKSLLADLDRILGVG